MFPGKVNRSIDGDSLWKGDRRMNCPECGGKTRVIDNRRGRRRRECKSCDTRFSTKEVVMENSISRPWIPSDDSSGKVCS
ncbi:NrdR family transcriptional regulator [Virgibacillus sediminis]